MNATNNGRIVSTEARNSSNPGKFPRVVIVGAGISGLCIAIKLKQAGIGSFTILEKSDDVGGTWLDNSYPGCGCDVPSMLYSFSFAPKHDWSRKYAPQSEILEYFRDCADRFQIREHIQFGTAVASAKFDEEKSVWRIETDQGDELEADVFVSAVGQLSRPSIPEIEGLDSFDGEAFHTARWNHDFDVTGQDIAVIGNGASAIQLVPKVAEQANKVWIFQRSPNWISRRHDYRYPRLAQVAFRWIPGVAKLHRLWIYLLSDMRILLYQRKSLLNKGFTGWLWLRMSRKLPKKLHDSVIPKYPAGCKRVLLSNDYLESLCRDNVEIVTKRIRGVTPEGIKTDAGVTPVDAIVLATGFRSSEFLVPMKVSGRDGIDLHEQWKARPRTYLGMTCPGFPNFFLLYGPNTNLGHNSIIFMVECQVRYILRCLSELIRRGDQTIEVREEAVEEFDRSLQEGLNKKVWNGYVNNWYKTADGHIINNWYGSTISYRRRTRKLDLKAFKFGKQSDTKQPDVQLENGEPVVSATGAVESGD